MLESQFKSSPLPRCVTLDNTLYLTWGQQCYLPNRALVLIKYKLNKAESTWNMAGAQTFCHLLVKVLSCPSFKPQSILLAKLSED